MRLVPLLPVLHPKNNKNLQRLLFNLFKVVKPTWEVTPHVLYFAKWTNSINENFNKYHFLFLII